MIRVMHLFSFTLETEVASYKNRTMDGEVPPGLSVSRPGCSF